MSWIITDWSVQNMNLLLDISVSPKNKIIKKIQQTSNFNLMVIYSTIVLCFLILLFRDFCSFWLEIYHILLEILYCGSENVIYLITCTAYRIQLIVETVSLIKICIIGVMTNGSCVLLNGGRSSIRVPIRSSQRL